jgi:hypothetical protein
VRQSVGWGFLGRFRRLGRTRLEDWRVRHFWDWAIPSRWVGLLLRTSSAEIAIPCTS